MGKLSRTATILAAAMAVMLLGAPIAAAQESNTIPVAEAREFLGQWTIAIDSEFGPIDLGLDIRDDSGNAAATLTSSFGGQETEQAIERISKDENSLVLMYTADMQGQPIPLTLRLTPAGDVVRATIDVGGGLFSAVGTARRG